MNRNLGVGQLLIAVYGIFAISASARATFQILTKFEEAPLAYSLSAFSALVYAIATFALAKSGKNWKLAAWISVGVELAGVLVVGLLSIVAPIQFDHPTVWSNFGAGYGYIPLILPVFGLIWLARRTR